MFKHIQRFFAVLGGVAASVLVRAGLVLAAGSAGDGGSATTPGVGATVNNPFDSGVQPIPLPGVDTAVNTLAVTIQHYGVFIGALGLAGGALYTHFGAVTPQAKARGWDIMIGAVVAIVLSLFMPDIFNFLKGL